jgi:hypothetical protein
MNRRTTTETSTSTTYYNSLTTRMTNTSYSYDIPYLKEILNLELPDINNIMNTINASPQIMPFRPIGIPIDPNDTDQTNDDGTNDAMQSAFKASQNSQIAISAAAKAVATCTAYGSIDCEQLMKTKNETDVYMKIASNSYHQAKASANTAMLSSSLSFSSFGPLDRRSTMMKDWLSKIAKSAVAQAQIAAQVTATASAQCEIIVDIKCNKCKNG